MHEEKQQFKSMSCRRNGYYQSKKGGLAHYASSYELRAFVILDEMKDVVSFMSQVRCKKDDRLFILDIVVKYKNETMKVIEIKPSCNFNLPKVIEQFELYQKYASQQGWKFEVWSEKELGFESDYRLSLWADEFISKLSGIDFVEERRKRGIKKVQTHYSKYIANDTIAYYCNYCKTNHTQLKITYDKTVAKHGRPICEREGGHIAGSRPKPHLIKENPYAAESKKECNECREVKLFELFSPDKTKRDGYSTRCKTCRAVANKKRYQENKKEKCT